MADNRALEEAVAGALGARGLLYAPADESSAAAWARLADSGLTLVGIAEEDGGAGGGIDDLVSIAGAMGGCGASFPLLETQIANLLLARIGVAPAPRSAAVLVPVQPTSTGAPGDACLTGEWYGRWVREAGTMLALYRQGSAWLVSQVTLEDGEQVADNAGEPITIAWRLTRTGECEPMVLAEADVAQVRAIAALGYLAQVLGAVSTATELALDYANTRSQFGRPIARFQRVQDHLCDCVEEALLLKALLVGATPGPGREVDLTSLSYARVAAAGCVARVFHAAHQVHGAIGYTQEHELHHFTLRSVAWCDAARYLFPQVIHARPGAIT